MDVEDIVREGTVTDVDNSRHIAKVWFDALGVQSDWLPVLINYPYMPAANERVLVLYFPLFNADGVILGGVRPWR